MRNREIYALCPRCTDNIPFIAFTDKTHRNLSIECDCNYHVSSMPLTEYLQSISSAKKKSNYNDSCIKHNKPFMYYSILTNEHLCEKCNPSDDIFTAKLDLPLNEIKKKINKADKFVNCYLKEIKDRAVNKEKEVIKQIENAYENCLNS